MVSLAERVDRTILRYSLLPPGARVIVALSGGADSTALACLLTDLAARRGFEVVAAAHFNHRLREGASDEDEAFCRELAERLGLHWLAGGGDVRAFAAGSGASLEDASRRMRYDFLRRCAETSRATRVAVGHTRDDQAETVLLQMVRGAGPRGLRGIPPVRPLVEGEVARRPGLGREAPGVLLVRPLLDVGHQELVAWLHARGGSFREDESNRDRRFLRNRVRHELIPFLRDRIAPSIVRVLSRNAEIASSDAELLGDLELKAYGRLAAASGEGVALDLDGVLGEPAAIRRRVVLRALGNLPGGRFVGWEQVERVLAVAEGRARGPIAVPGGTATVAGGRLVLAPDVQRTPGLNFPGSALSIPGEARVAGFVVSSFVCQWNGPVDGERLRAPGAGTAEAIVDASRATGLSVRTRRPGDWLRPLGLGGRTKKLQDYFVDRKVPRAARDTVPLVVDARDRIVWVAGHGIDEEFRVGEGTRDVVILKLRGESA